MSLCPERPDTVLPRARIGSQFLGKYSDSVQAAFVYPSSNYEDDLAWGASWLFRKTGEKHFLDVRSPAASKIQHAMLCYLRQTLCCLLTSCRPGRQHILSCVRSRLFTRRRSPAAQGVCRT